ncbi:MAG: (Fe-S)-binding protein [Chloroflexi bacterium]|nr:(Fe-S)-binding protein [Chloroflexota bacterium]MDA1226491.1 (Fe-S)-binding protein [Chloroflexota bacterium]
MTSPPVKPGLSLFFGPDAPEESDLYKCVHCGFCLQACPTYVDTGLEAESPRGRIALMKAVNEGRIGITDTVVRHWDLCIQCRACEVACPSGVPYGRLIEATMQQVEHRRKTGLLTKLISNVSLKGILPHQGRLALLLGGMRMYQLSGLQNMVRKTGVLRLFPGDIAEMESSLPVLPRSVFEAKGQVIPAQGKKRARVALLSGCVMPLVNGPEMNAVVRVLARNGCEVVVTRGQVCCGAINTHVGDLETARDLAKRNIDAFNASGVDAVIVASAGCGSRMKEYDHLLRQDEQYAEKAAKFSEKVKDIHEFLVELPFEEPKGHLDYRVTYQDSCHLSNGQRVTAQPRTLLRSIPGIDFVELSNAAMCCGAGGTYTLTERDSSMRVLDTKMSAVKKTGATVIATANPGCLLQLQYGAKREGLDLKIRYVTDLLDESYRLEPKE